MEHIRPQFLLFKFCKEKKLCVCVCVYYNYILQSCCLSILLVHIVFVLKNLMLHEHFDRVHLRSLVRTWGEKPKWCRLLRSSQLEKQEILFVWQSCWTADFRKLCRLHSGVRCSSHGRELEASTSITDYTFKVYYCSWLYIYETSSFGTKTTLALGSRSETLKHPSCCLKSLGQDVAFVMYLLVQQWKFGPTSSSSSGHIWHRACMFGSIMTINRWISLLRTISALTIFS